MSQNEAGTPRQSAKQPVEEPKERLFIVIHNDRVVFECEDLSEAVDKHRSLQGSAVYGRVLSNTPPIDKGPVPNPVGPALESLSLFLEEDIFEAISKAIGRKNGVTDGSNCGGWAFDHCVMRTATNAECASWNVDLNLQGRFDLRKPLPGQIGQWLRTQGTRLGKAAATVESLQDDRNRRIIRKLVADESFMQSVIDRGLKFEYDGSLVVDEVAAYRKLRSASSEGGDV